MKAYHYTECGLDDVWLTGGFEEKTFGEYGTAVAVHDEKGLWKVLARNIVRQDRRMVGQELKFLRTLLDWTQTDLGKRLGYNDGQTVAKWEKARHDAVPLNADTFVRATYCENLGERPMVTRVNSRLLEILDVAARQCRRVLEEGPMGQWTAKEAPSEMEFAKIARV
ncbi:helix-turn-helix transcriptional regulator [Acidisphaera sp. S103]|uniref:helix-turn-helix transcriptional regulator n=1 Tax=Acidisphaera sp. S103 TaxID=1747223 RepID=UPI00131E0810|nr:helix-turn-helix transcriptional regulator [Acidisphaera sp. S103]